MTRFATTGAISLSALRSHLSGGAGSVSFSELREGGGLTPNTSANNPIPNSGQISLNQLYGVSNESTLEVIVMPTEVSGTGSESGNDNGETGSAFANDAGGGSNTYAWTRISGDAEVAATNPNGQTTTFIVNGNPPQRGHYTAVFQCTVTSEDGQTASDTVEITDINILI